MDCLRLKCLDATTVFKVTTGVPAVGYIAGIFLGALVDMTFEIALDAICVDIQVTG